MANNEDDYFDPEQPYEVAGMLFDPQAGIGTFPNSSEVNYFGFAVWMTPKDFISLNELRTLGERSSTQFMLNAIKEKKSFGMPSLHVKVLPTGDFRVVGHEGRGRMMLLAQRDPNALVPVHVLPVGKRSRSFDGQSLVGKKIYADEEATFQDFVFTINKVTHNKRIYKS
jgi:hypothetical protein